MKNFRIIIIIMVLIWVVYPVFPQNLSKLQENLNVFSDSMNQALPFNSTIGLNWSDAYIGQITDLPHHFGVGVSAGFTNLDLESIKSLLGSFNLPVPIINNRSTSKKIGFLIPCYTVEGRIGGFFLPFDIGLKAGYLPPDAFMNIFDKFDYGLKQMIFGADIRYSFINYKTIPIKFSVGLGFNYLQGGINSAIPSAQSYSFTDFNNKDYKIKTAPSGSKADIEWRTANIEFKSQFSFPFRIITPYAGAGLSYAWSRAGYRVSTPQLSIENGTFNNVQGVLLEKYNLTYISDNGFETINKFNNISTRAFGGISVNMAFIRIDLTGMYEFIGGNFGATLGFRFQL